MQNSLTQLTHAFDLFSQETARLEQSYHALHNRFEQMSQQLEASNNRLNGILEHMSQGLVFLDSRGHILTFNPAAEEILGVFRAEVLHKSFWDYFTDNALGFSMRQCLEHEQTIAICFPQFKDSKGITRELEVSTRFIPQTRLTDEGLLLLIRDLTEVRRLQEMAQRNERMKELGEMAASVAHEIRNPLSGIKGFASLLQRDLEGQPHLQQMASYIVEGTDTLNRLVSNVLHHSKPLQLHFEITNLTELIKEALEVMKMDPSYNSAIIIDLHPPPSPLSATVDRSLFKSALLNLFVNALQAMPERGKLSVRIALQNSVIHLTIGDTGIGISKEHLHKVFSPFFTTKAHGNGLGLAEVYKVIQAHGGVIDVQSQVGVGTQFTIKIAHG